VFDDTIEHEAWNDSDQTRIILIFDIWRPELSAAERDAVTAVMTASDAFVGDPPDQGV
jgi:aspartyl/asparaginyl beta-hydroxylase (cupin superfamily)